ncbi:protein of unknown function [Georgfuchsia toluolica]|uniref:Uncharacterized protein n=1 Tax=Georgfuchsia toluolica TaxID=424218 RepID=A0A916N3Q2_9PROT|nr:protein of unknown function [Georgfuchsia toluolica]
MNFKHPEWVNVWGVMVILCHKLMLSDFHDLPIFVGACQAKMLKGIFINHDDGRAT